ncbi:MAG: hypothetical protein CMJ78_20990 [Planctomycetaceae bacterium]|nr:hypothetical protein [Planctomycetaceae bacterium]
MLIQVDTEERIMLRLFFAIALMAHAGSQLLAADKPLKVFILAGQSNMVGRGNNLELDAGLSKGNDRVLMFEKGKWQPLKPVKKAQKFQEKLGLTEFSFGPEIAFAHEIAKAWPDERIGIVKFAIGGTSILTWRPDWSKEDAHRVGQARMGSLYKALMSKVAQARKAEEVDFVGVLWLQGGSDMLHFEVAKEYSTHLKALITSIRKDTKVAQLPFLCGSMRRKQDPADLSDLVPKRVKGRYAGAEFVLKAQWDMQSDIKNTRTVILRSIETHPKNVHFNTAGQLEVGKLFAKEFLEMTK